MAHWAIFDADWPTPPYPYPYSYENYKEPQPDATLNTFLNSQPEDASKFTKPRADTMPRGDNPREIRNKAEKQRRDKLNQSITELASMVPPVVASSRKIDKTGVLRLTAHYLRAHQYVFGDSLNETKEFTISSAEALLSLLNGFLLTTTYRGLVVVVSQNMSQHLGYNELDLLGQSLYSIVHEEDHTLLRDQLMPKVHLLGPNGELLVPEESNGRRILEEMLNLDQRHFIIRFRKHGQRSEPVQYVTCHVEGSFRKSDRACRGYSRCCQVVRRARARSDNPCSSGNDVVFIGVVRPTVETFLNESHLEAFRLEYRTRHSIDGEIIQCEQRIALVTGYMTSEVNGVNAMNFMHKDDVQWVIIALREMYVKKRLFGESCYRLMTKNGQFIYMRTRGCLDVDNDSRACTTFVCTNTVIGEKEGKHLIKLMKKKFTLTLNENQQQHLLEEEDEVPGSESMAVKDPRLLEKDILHLVTDLPSTSSDRNGGDGDYGLTIIPPKKERIVSAIEKIYTVMKTVPKEPTFDREKVPPNTPTVEPHVMPTTSRQNQKVTTFEDTYMPHLQMTSDFEADSPTTKIIDADNYSPKNNIPQRPHISTGARLKEKRKRYCPLRYVPCTITNEQVAGPSQNIRQIVMKRPFKSSGSSESTTTKKTNDNHQKQQASDWDSPDLETVLDEAITNARFSQIDNALQYLDGTISPTFPSLLSNEVQDILSQIEKEARDSDT